MKVSVYVYVWKEGNRGTESQNSISNPRDLLGKYLAEDLLLLKNSSRVSPVASRRAFIGAIFAMECQKGTTSRADLAGYLHREKNVLHMMSKK